MPDSNSSPAVSIILPTYNRAGFIVETIGSIQNQTFQNWELIVIDDGSDDDTEQKIAGLNDGRIRFYKAGRIGSIGKLREMGIGEVSAEFIAFADSDDLWEPTKLESQLSALQKEPAAGFCMTNGYNFIHAGVPIDYFYPQRDGMKTGNFFESFFRSELAVYIQSLLFRKSCLDKIGFDETDNDIDFILRVAKNFTGIILYKPMLFRRIHAGNYSGINWEKNYGKGITAIEFYQKDIPGNMVKDALFRLYINFGEDCIKHHEKRKAINCFIIAWKNRPFSIIPFKKIMKALLK